MEIKTAPNIEAVIRETLPTLAKALNETAICRDFIQAMDAASHDPEVNRLLRAIYETQGNGFSTRQLGPTLVQLQTELEALPLIVSLRQVEQGMRALLTAVDDIISQAAGVSFAANAQRSCAVRGITVEIPAKIQTLARQLGETLRQTRAVQAYLAADSEFQADLTARTMSERLQEALEDLKVYFRDISAELSQHLGVDYAAMVEPSDSQA